jgi:hypothetical protein
MTLRSGVPAAGRIGRVHARTTLAFMAAVSGGRMPQGTSEDRQKSVALVDAATNPVASRRVVASAEVRG